MKSEPECDMDWYENADSASIANVVLAVGGGRIGLVGLAVRSLGNEIDVGIHLAGSVVEPLLAPWIDNFNGSVRSLCPSLLIIFGIQLGDVNFLIEIERGSIWVAHSLAIVITVPIEFSVENSRVACGRRIFTVVEFVFLKAFFEQLYLDSGLRGGLFRVDVFETAERKACQNDDDRDGDEHLDEGEASRFGIEGMMGFHGFVCGFEFQPLVVSIMKQSKGMLEIGKFISRFPTTARSWWRSS